MSVTPLFDTHCHLADAKLLNQASELGARAVAAGLGGLCVIMADTDNLETVSATGRRLQAAHPHAKIAWTAGIHPHEAKTLSSDVQARVRALALEARAIGETGLDFHYNFSEPDEQHAAFDWHIDLACELQKPLVIHCREAKTQIYKHLDRHDVRTHARPGILHCFTEDWDFAKQVLDLGFMVSFSGILTFPKAEALREVARQVPLDRLLIETDSPYLAPKPHRGKSNEPSFVTCVFECLKELRTESEETLREALWRNSLAIYQFESGAA
jgi:TatD DNase family protein